MTAKLKARPLRVLDRVETVKQVQQTDIVPNGLRTGFLKLP